MQQYLFFKKNYLFFLQPVLLSLGAIGYFFIKGLLGFKSVLLGGGAWIIPAMYFAWRFHHKPLSKPQEMLIYFLLSEGIKLLLSFVIIILILSTCIIDRLSFLIGYITMVATSFLILLRYRVENGRSLTSN